MSIDGGAHRSAYLHIREVILISVIEALHDTGLITLAVMQHADQTVHEYQQAGGNRCHNYHDKSGDVTRGVLFLHDERANEIAWTRMC
jgi:hypothetical protein